MQAEATQVCGGLRRQRVRGRRGRVAADPGTRRADDRSLEIAGAARFDQLPAQRAEEGSGECRDSHRAHASQPADRLAEERIVGESAEKLGVIVIDGENEAKSVDGGLARGPDHKSAVG